MKAGEIHKKRLKECFTHPFSILRFDQIQSLFSNKISIFHLGIFFKLVYNCSENICFQVD